MGGTQLDLYLVHINQMSGQLAMAKTTGNTVVGYCMGDGSDWSQHWHNRYHRPQLATRTNWINGYCRTVCEYISIKWMRTLFGWSSRLKYKLWGQDSN